MFFKNEIYINIVIYLCWIYMKRIILRHGIILTVYNHHGPYDRILSW